MRIWPRKAAQAPEGGFPPLRVTYRYTLVAPAAGSVEATYTGRSADDLLLAVEQRRKDDTMISLGRADTEGQEALAFPARSILDIKVRLAKPEEL
jgi:hypothetical protein